VAGGRGLLPIQTDSGRLIAVAVVRAIIFLEMLAGGSILSRSC